MRICRYVRECGICCAGSLRAGGFTTIRLISIGVVLFCIYAVVSSSFISIAFSNSKAWLIRRFLSRDTPWDSANSPPATSQPPMSKTSS
jgi:hypothetical protein